MDTNRSDRSSTAPLVSPFVTPRVVGVSAVAGAAVVDNDKLVLLFDLDTELFVCDCRVGATNENAEDTCINAANATRAIGNIFVLIIYVAFGWLLLHP